jgi:hypothetical protein
MRGGLADSEDSLDSTVADTTPVPAQFGHYQLLYDEKGKPFVLGRGAMGITYKAYDADLERAAALKVINENFPGDENARKRFLREARAAASVRHTYVASVFYLGKTGENYF